MVEIAVDVMFYAVGAVVIAFEVIVYSLGMLILNVPLLCVYLMAFSLKEVLRLLRMRGKYDIIC